MAWEYAIPAGGGGGGFGKPLHEGVVLAGLRTALDPSLTAEEQLSRLLAFFVGMVGLAPAEGNEWSEATWDAVAAAVLEALGPTRDLRELVR